MSSNYFKKYYLLENIDEVQIELSDRFIKSNINSFISLLKLIREELDRFVFDFHNKNEIKQTELVEIARNTFDGDIHKITKHYPIGDCFPITKIIYTYLQAHYLKDENLVFLKNFIESGGVFKMIWGQIDNSYFQTAFQLGNYYVDVASDTTDIKNEKVEYKLFSEAHFSNVKTLIEFIEIKKKYHEVEIIPNIYYPEIVHIIPFFEVTKTKELIITTSNYVNYMVRSNVNLLIDFLNNYKFEDTNSVHIQSLDYQFEQFRQNKIFSKLLEKRVFDGGFEKWTNKPLKAFCSEVFENKQINILINRVKAFINKT